MCEESAMIVSFCGHADYIPSKQDEKRILDFLEEKIGNQSAELFFGGYGNFDGFALLCGKRYQLTHPNVKLILITPYLTEGFQKNRLNEIRSEYDEILYPPLEKVPKRYAILRRNQWMAEQADYVVAYVTHSWGGAYQTLQHAKKRHKEILSVLH